jgi:peptidoglycan/LPS O-acetylase OafA/YrhL
MSQVNRLGFDQIPATLGRIPGLDGLRALSILIVVLGHFFLPATGGVAALGVYVFFAISGFLITRLLFLENKQAGGVSAKNFYMRRFFRLYPVLLFYLLFISAVNYIHGDKNDVSEIFSVLLYYINYLTSFRILQGEPLTMQVGVLWSLAIEEHFYLIMPLFFIAVKGRVRPLLWFSGLACVIPLLLRVLYVSLWPETIGQLITYRNSETRFDSIAVGVLLAALCEGNMREKIVRFLSSPTMFVAGALTVLASVLVKEDLFKETLRFSLISLSCVPLICGIVFGERLRLFQAIANWSPVVWIGKLSYSLYVWHGFTAYLLKILGYPEDSVDFGILGVSLTFSFAAFSYYLVETPFLRLRAQFVRAPKIEPAVTAMP